MRKEIYFSTTDEAIVEKAIQLSGKSFSGLIVKLLDEYVERESGKVPCPACGTLVNRQTIGASDDNEICVCLHRKAQHTGDVCNERRACGCSHYRSRMVP